MANINVKVLLETLSSFLFIFYRDSLTLDQGHISIFNISNGETFFQLETNAEVKPHSRMDCLCPVFICCYSGQISLRECGSVVTVTLFNHDGGHQWYVDHFV